MTERVAMGWLVSLDLDPVPPGTAEAAAELGGRLLGTTVEAVIAATGPVAAAEALRLAQTRLSAALRAAGGQGVTSASIAAARVERAPATA